MTRSTLRRGAAFGAAAGVLAALTVAVPTTVSAATAVPGVAYIDATVAASSSLKVAGVDGSSPVSIIPAGLQATSFAASSDTDAASSTVAVVVRTIAPKVQDTTSALVVTHGGVSKVVSSFTDANPVVSADGLFVWFLTHGNLWKYDVVAGTAVQINGGAEFNPWAAAPGSHSYVYRLAVSTDGSKAAELLQSYPNSGPGGVNRSQVRVFDIVQTGASFDKTPIWTSFNYLGNTLTSPQLLPYNFVFTDSDTLVTGECVNDPCATWTTFSVNTSTAPDGVKTGTGITALPNLNNLLSLRQTAGTWWAWALDQTAHTLTPSTTTDNTFATPLTAAAAWAGADHDFAFIQPVADTPATFTSLAAKMGVAATLNLSAKSVNSGAQVHFDGFGTYPAPLSGEVVQKETGQVWKGQLQSSIDAGKTWTVAGATTFGGGLTAKLTRTTQFRWFFAGDALTAPAYSGRKVVSVTPGLTVKVTKSGTRRIVAGTTTRVGGTITLFKLTGRKYVKVLATTISAKGGWSFGKRLLAAGAYRVVTTPDASWASAAKAFRI
jgi:hypothetical protein